MSIKRPRSHDGSASIRETAADLALEHADPFDDLPAYGEWSETVDVVQTDLERAIRQEVSN